MWQVTVSFRDGNVVSGRARRIECYDEVGGPIVVIEWERDPARRVYESEVIEGMYLVSVEAKGP